ncbi:MAG: hypothetical protein LPK09_07045 [Hymenobacteraceae bacterium]|nr:hypothetical protein [Hymenobacteraceae bacterium]
MKKVWQQKAGIKNIFDLHYRQHLAWGFILRPGRHVFVQMGTGFYEQPTVGHYKCIKKTKSPYLKLF